MRTRHLNQLEQTERAVLVKEVVVEVNILQLPEVVDHPIDLALVQLQGVLPDIPALHVRVLLDLLNIGHQVEAARIAARQPPVNIEQRVILLGGHGAEVDRPGQPHGAVVIALVQPQQGVTEHGGRAVQIGGGENQHRALGVHRATPLLILRAMGERLRFPPTECFGDETIAGGKAATGRGGFLLQRLHRGRQLRDRIGGAVGGQEKVRVIHIAALAVAQGGAGVDMQKRLPAWLLCKLFQVPGLGDGCAKQYQDAQQGGTHANSIFRWGLKTRLRTEAGSWGSFYTYLASF